MSNHVPILVKPPYVGVAAVRTQQHVEHLVAYADALPGWQVLACGIQVSDKTLRGEPNRHPTVFPPAAELRQLVPPNEVEGVEFHIHFSPDERGHLKEKLQRIADLVGASVQGLQLNQSYPDPEAVAWWRITFPLQRIILPITRKMVAAANENPIVIYQELQRYDGTVTDLLFDLSGGRGQLLQAELAASYLGLIRARWLSLRIGAAGGLGPSSMGPVEEMARHLMWPFNFDAQSQLCDENGLNISLAKRFIENAGKITARAAT